MSKVRGRPVSVGKIRSDFYKHIKGIEDLYKEIEELYKDKNRGLSLKHQRALSEYFFLSAAVAWEVF